MPNWEDVEIVTIAQAKQHARLPTTTEQDADLELKLAQAHALVLDYVARPSDADWTAEMEIWDDESAPKAIQAAIMRQFADLARFRGDDDEPSEGRVDGTDLSPRVKQLLRLYRMPVLR